MPDKPPTIDDQENTISFEDLRLERTSPVNLELPKQLAITQLSQELNIPIPNTVLDLHFTPPNAMLAYEASRHAEQKLSLSPAEKTYNKIGFFEALIEMTRQRDQLDIDQEYIFTSPNQDFARFLRNNQKQLGIKFGLNQESSPRGLDFALVQACELFDSVVENLGTIQSHLDGLYTQMQNQLNTSSRRSD